MLDGIETSAALHTLHEPDEMATETDQITLDESELLEAESLAARPLDQDLAAGLRQRRIGGETSSATCATSATGRGSRPRSSDG